MNTRRIERLQELIKARIAEIVQQDIADPRLGMVTVTRVELDREMDHCKVFWSVLGDEKARKLSEHALQHARRYIQREMGSTLHTRKVPEVRFLFDESIEGAIRVNALIKKLADERQQRDDEEGSEGDDEPRAPE